MCTSASSQSTEMLLDPEEWVDAYGDQLFRFAYRRLRDENAAEEVVQETFLAGLRFQHQYTGRGSQAAWLVSILRRKILDHIRMRARRYSREVGQEFDPSESLFDQQGRWKSGMLPTFDAAQQVESRELWTIVQYCLDRLPQSQADVFTLSAIDGMESEEICKELEISASNLWVRLHRARLSLANCVGAKWFARPKSTPEMPERNQPEASEPSQREFDSHG